MLYYDLLYYIMRWHTVYDMLSCTIPIKTSTNYQLSTLLIALSALS